MLAERSVIVEYALPKESGLGGRWVVVEVRYDATAEQIHYGRPEILSIPDSKIRDGLTMLFTTMLAAKAEFFAQVTKAILKDEKRRKNKEGK